MSDSFNIAIEIYGDLEGAMHDLARCTVDSQDYDTVDAEADRIWNDPTELRDIIGDRIFDASKGLKDKKLALEICTDLMSIGHSALEEAVRGFIRDQKLEE